ncbi:MAG: aminotransferase class V-fold PLP-dependent enzyme [Alphaproteobacteria bacterium]|nr:aminotransferase class V-fold PLP-dependent enzyme [Alphaproteobacteria bacterium]
MFGAGMRDLFPLDPEVVYINHGTVGVTPWRVLNAQQEIRDAMERQPSRYVLRELAEAGMDGLPGQVPRMRRAAAEVAAFVGAERDDLVFVDNATTGINAVLRSFAFAPGDALVVTGLGYGSINHTAAYVARERGIELVTVDLPVVVDGPDALVRAFEAGLPPNARVAVIDHICSDTGMQWPVRELVEVCHANGTLALVDGAHAPGCIPLDVPSIGADWYVANLHKWGLAPRSSAFLWAPPARQHGLHPVVISWGLDQGFTTEFDYVGTRDPSAHLAAPEGLAMLAELGLDEVLAYNQALALEGAQIVCDAVGARMLHPPEMATCMVSVRLPERFGTTREAMVALRRSLLYDHAIEAAAAFREGRISLRLAAQIYNTPADYVCLANVLKAP